jgi:hypothetical protein
MRVRVDQRVDGLRIQADVLVAAARNGFKLTAPWMLLDDHLTGALVSAIPYSRELRSRITTCPPPFTLVTLGGDASHLGPGHPHLEAVITTALLRTLTGHEDALAAIALEHWQATTVMCLCSGPTACHQVLAALSPAQWRDVFVVTNRTGATHCEAARQLAGLNDAADILVALLEDGWEYRPAVTSARALTAGQ